MTVFDMAWSVVKNDPMDGADDFYDQLKDGLEARLIDDGTMDTVVSVNGKQYRFNYMPEMGDGGDDFLDEIESTVNDGEHSYAAFVDYCIDDAKEMYISELIEDFGRMETSEEAFDRHLEEQETQAYRDGEMTDDERQDFLSSSIGAKWREEPESKEVKTE